MVLSTSSFESFLQLLIAIIAFVIVLFLTYFTTKFIGNYQKANSVGTNFETIETYRISNTKYIQLLRIGKKYVVIAVCKESITLITELNEEDVSIPDYSVSKEPFSKVFENIKKKHFKDNKDKEDNVNDDSDEI